MMACPVKSSAILKPDRIFIWQSTISITFAEFEQRVMIASEKLLSDGIQPGDRLLIPVEKNGKSLEKLFACIRIGAVAIPIDNHLPEQRISVLKKSFSTKVLNQASTDNRNSGGASPRCLDNDAAVLGIFTSGSSGTPKLVFHSFPSLLNNARASNRRIPLVYPDKTLLSLPLYHIGGLAQVFRALLSQTTLVVDGVVEDPYVLNQQAITHTSMVATQLQRLLACNAALPNLKAVLLGGGPCPKALIDLARGKNYPIWKTYGMTENASQLITESPSGEQEVLEGSEITLAESGELLVKGGSLFLGYWCDGKLDTARDSGGWFHSGDMAKYIGGKLIIDGRLDNQFISGGKNIQPEEVEQNLITLDIIETAIVVPVAHSEFGFTPFAFVGLKHSAELDDKAKESIIDELKGVLPGFLVPRYYAELPSFEGLKPKRQDLKVLAKNLQEKRI
ncbi:AMP-binding protein [Teredinibacter haidensis]|uniref:AMP-binding protein n=1 Tax=Teredinibacter haidensis TaxID=2731755 RepID=UPI00094918A9|nr:AMP-binding protein [Teredinibacter haidensis]